jgi:hypothetical protein
MKRLFIFLFVALSLQACSQIPIPYSKSYDSSVVSKPYPPDTLKVVVMYCDTSGTDHSIKWMSGYVVRHIAGYYEQEVMENISECKPYYKAVAFLNDRKKPFPKNLLLIDILY